MGFSEYQAEAQLRNSVLDWADQMLVRILRQREILHPASILARVALPMIAGNALCTRAANVTGLFLREKWRSTDQNHDDWIGFFRSP
jgi:hypothetical protein